jgi:hypothetical protein
MYSIFVWSCSLYVRIYAWLVSPSVFNLFLTIKEQRSTNIRTEYPHDLFQSMLYLEAYLVECLITAFGSRA